MKKYVLSAALLLCGALGAYAQTKGTNSVGLGFETVKSKFDAIGGSSSNENRFSSYSIRYANFIKDDVKLGISLAYADQKNNEDTELKTYGASFLYQKYFPVYKKLYVFIGGEASYYHSKASNFEYIGGIMRETGIKGNGYSLGAYGGASYFLGKHWELETRILSASAGYANSKNAQSGYTTKTSNFSLKTAGAFTNLGFSINFLF